MLHVKRHLHSYNLFLVLCLWKLFWLFILLQQLSVSRVDASMIMMAAAATSSSSSSHSDMQNTSDLASTWKPRPIPKGPLVIGYAHDATSGKVQEALRRGVNVICWSFVDMVAAEEDNNTIRNNNHNNHNNNDNDNSSSTTQSQQILPTIQTNLDIEAIRAIRNEPSHQHVVHIAAIGGWNGPHPPSGAATGKEWCHKFVDFNRQHGYIFDGIDWDLEGQDDREGPRSKFTLETLDIMSDFSIEAKQGYGMMVSMAPAESYLDCTGSSSSDDLEFSLHLNLFPRSWKHHREDQKLIEDAQFAHAGRQCYAYVLHKAGIETFDWVALQLYEAYSVFVHDVTRRRHRKASDAMVERAEQFQKGYTVFNLPGDTTSKTTTNAKIQIPLSKLVMGIANGWADGTKFCQVSVESLQESLDTLNDRYGETYRGVMFWTIDEEGAGGIHMASSMASLQFENPRTKEEF